MSEVASSPDREGHRSPSERRERVAGNRPLLLADPDAAWVVETGYIHVFAVPIEHGVPAGAREYLFSVEPGGALFGIAPDESGSGLLAVGTPGTALRPLNASDGPQTVETWVAELSAVLGDQRPRDAREVAMDVQVDVDDGEAVHAVDRLVWVTVVEGRLHLNGVSAAVIEAGHSPLPLSPRAWLRSAGPSRLVAGRGPGLAGAEAVEALRQFHRLVLGAVGARVHAVTAARTARSRSRRAADDDAVDDGLAELLEVFERSGTRGRPASTAPRRTGAGDPLLGACRLVGNALGVTIQPASASEAGRGDLLAGIARASRLRIRQVTLDSDWWRFESGPLVGFELLTGRPVALLSASRRSYDVVDPSTGSRVRVTADVAATLSPVAHSLYRPFPERRIGALDLLRFGLRGGRVDVGNILLMGALGGLLALVVPVATGLLFDRFLPADDGGGVLQVALALVASVGAIAAFQITRGIAVTRLGGRMDFALEAAVWDRLLNLPAPFFRSYSSGDLALRATSISTMRRALSGVVTTAILGAVFSLFSYALLFVYDIGLALVATGLLFVALAVGVVAFLIQVRDQRAASRTRGQQAGLVLEMLTGMPKLRVGGAEARAFSVWARLVGGATARRAALVATQVNVVYAALPLLALLVIFPIAGLRQGGDLSAGTFLAFNAALTQVLTAVIALGTALSAIAQILPLYERIKPILTALPEADEARADPGELVGDIDVNDVTFRYVEDGPPVLDQVSFRARPGEFVALVGPSGSGKSTILRLLLGFETPESGSIHLDAQDLATLDLRAVRRQMGVVLQSGKLASGSIYQNIVGSLALTIDEAWEAARMSGLDADIQQMPMGMHTMVIEGGGGLSGGQRQRLMIARAIVSRPRIVLFDEATSALDNRTQAVVSESLERLSATRIVIAHRLSTVINADQIHVVEAGHLVESGTYEELMGQHGPFAALAARQLV